MAKTLTGIVASDKTDKTIVVSVQTHKNHPLYRKQYITSKRFLAHDAKNEAHTGDTVVISECRPLSARKRFTLEKITKRAPLREDQTVEAVTAEPVVTETTKEETK